MNEQKPIQPIQEESLQTQKSSSHTRLLIGIVFIFGVLIALGIGALFYTNTNEPEYTACTLEAKICPDGTAVGRTGPNCEFAKCPGEE